MTYTVLYVRQFNCFMTFIWDLGPATLVLVQMKGPVPHFVWSHGVVPGVLVAGWCSLDRTSMSRMLVSCLYAISGCWLKIAANLPRDCKRLQFDWMILRTRLVDGWYDWLITGLFSVAIFVFGLQSLLTWNGSDLLNSSSNYVFRVLSLDEEFNHLLRFFFEVCVGCYQ